MDNPLYFVSKFFRSYKVMEFPHKHQRIRLCRSDVLQLQRTRHFIVVADSLIGIQR